MKGLVVFRHAGAPGFDSGCLTGEGAVDRRGYRTESGPGERPPASEPPVHYSRRARCQRGWPDFLQGPLAQLELVL